MGKVSPKKLPKMIPLELKKEAAFKKVVRKVGKSMKAKKLEEEERNQRGIILVSHLPYGFFEEALKGFFKQFGHIRRIRLARSPKTGRSKGYAFIEFEYPEVAKIAAESMNNYLMYERIIKCKVLDEPDLNAKKIFATKYITKTSFPTLHNRRKLIKNLTVPLEEEAVQSKLNSRTERIATNNKKLTLLGINYKYEDVPSSVDQLDPVKTEPKSEKKLTPKSKLSPKSRRSLDVIGKTAASPAQPNSTSQKLRRSMDRKSTAKNQVIDMSALETALDSKSPKIKRRSSVEKNDTNAVETVPVTKSPKIKRRSSVEKNDTNAVETVPDTKSPKMQRRSSVEKNDTNAVETVPVTKSPKIKRRSSVEKNDTNAVETVPVTKSPKIKRRSSVEKNDTNVVDTMPDSKSAKMKRRSSEKNDTIAIEAVPDSKSPKITRRSLEEKNVQESPAGDLDISASVPKKAKSPKGRKASIAQVDTTESKTKGTKPKFSPKQLRSRARSSVAPVQVDEVSEPKKAPVSAAEPKKTKFSPKALRSQGRKSTAQIEVTEPKSAEKKPKFSPKVLRSTARKSEAPVPAKSAVATRRKSMK